MDNSTPHLGCPLDGFAVEVDPVRAVEGGEDGHGVDCIVKSKVLAISDEDFLITDY